MPAEVKPRRAYNTSLRQEQAQLTRERILDAARRLLLQGVYSQVTMEEIAREAGVAYQTLYAVFRTKLRVAEAIVDAGWPHVAAAVQLLEATAASADPEAWLTTVATMSRRIYEPCADLERFLRESGDVSLLGRYRQARESRYRRLQALRPILESAARVRPGLTPAEAVDLVWSLSGPENYIELVFERGWSADRYEAWLGDALRRLVLVPSDPA
jgi:TetR/AcrR family transcriptional regulator, regulator of autoinduction and epiphytic fitness